MDGSEGESERGFVAVFGDKREDERRTRSVFLKRRSTDWWKASQSPYVLLFFFFGGSTSFHVFSSVESKVDCLWLMVRIWEDGTVAWWSFELRISFA